ncbi:endoribonuclease LACTB2-like [Oppia nitens]|uniref:endoribonuclease LACTB2-like n=1 Tax=Oppia nitens TaxID=1686743 RepID=UPI0023DA57CD|nr:endoribonuclease LACTB2-like [Oppia nitens]
MTAIIPKVSQLTSRIIRILGCNPGVMTLQGTNTYLVGNGPNRVLIDTGDADVGEYVTNLKTIVDDNGINLSQIVVTHWHHDHIGGVADILSTLKLNDCKIYKICDEEHDRQYQSSSFKLNYLADGQKLEADGATLRVVATPGHTGDHMILVLEQENAIFSGDCILGEGTAVFEDLYSYIKSLKTILELKPSVIYPGHGPVIDEPIGKINEYIAHRQQREDQIVNVMVELGKELTPMEIVKIVYKDVPEKLHLAAAVNVGHHLEKLVKEQRVEKIDFNNQLSKYRIK